MINCFNRNVDPPIKECCSAVSPETWRNFAWNRALQTSGLLHLRLWLNAVVCLMFDYCIGWFCPPPPNPPWGWGGGEGAAQRHRVGSTCKILDGLSLVYCGFWQLGGNKEAKNRRQESNQWCFLLQPMTILEDFQKYGTQLNAQTPDKDK